MGVAKESCEYAKSAKFIAQAVERIVMQDEFHMPDWLELVPTVDKSIFEDGISLDDVLDESKPIGEQFSISIDNSDLNFRAKHVINALYAARALRVKGKYIRYHDCTPTVKIGTIREMPEGVLRNIDGLNAGGSYVLKKLFG